MLHISFDLKDGETVVMAESNKMYCTAIANQLNAIDGGVIKFDTDISEFVNVIYLFKDKLTIPDALKHRDDIIYYDISFLTYTAEYWSYIQTTQPLLDELAKLLPVDNLVRIEREKFKREYQEAELARVSKQATACCSGH